MTTSWVARWFIFKPKIPVWVNFGGCCDGRFWYILWPFGIFYGRQSYLLLFGIFKGNSVHFTVLVSRTKKNLATLDQTFFVKTSSFTVKKSDLDWPKIAQIWSP
jgi:hypothetical protein